MRNGNGNNRHKLSTRQRAARTWRLLRIFGRQFKVFFIVSAVAFLTSALLLYYIYPRHELPEGHHTFLGICYDTLLMTFFNPPIPFVDDWRLVPVFFGLPILGLCVIAEGVINLGQLLLQHRTNSRQWQKMVAATYENHIVVAGLGNVGFRVVQQLAKFGEEVVCIEKDEDAKFMDELAHLEVPLLIGDVTNEQTLRDASIDKAKAFMALTDNDLANLEAALTVRELMPNIRVIIRMFDQRLAHKIEKGFGINCAFSTSALAAPVFAQAALSGNILASFEFGGAVVNAFNLEIATCRQLQGLTIDAVRNQYEVTVLMHSRGSVVDWNPPPTTQLESGDQVLIMADNKNIQNFLIPSTPAT
jgi:Trk K+ transport system NAD-binding subunit